MPKPALLIISAASVVGENRKRLDTLARFFDLTCVTCRSVRSIGFDVTLEPASEPHEYRLLPLPTLGRAETTTRYLLRGLGRALAGLRFDAVLVESEPWAWVRWQTWLYTRLRHRRAIFGEFSWENSARPGLKGALLGVCYRLACRTDNFAIAGNRAAGELFLSHGLDSARLLVAPQFGVDETLFCPPAPDARSGARIREGLAPQAFVVGFCGRFIREKGVLDLVDAVDAAHASHPGRAIQLALLGSGPLGAELGRMAAQRPWLRLLASRSHGEVAGFMQLLDLFVLPSKPTVPPEKVWQEQFGHVLIEAMACGVPCIGSDSGAIPEVIGDPAALFPAGDRIALSALICRVLGSAGDATSQRERVLAQFTNRAVASRWAEFILARLAAGRPPVPARTA